MLEEKDQMASDRKILKCKGASNMKVGSYDVGEDGDMNVLREALRLEHEGGIDEQEDKGVDKEVSTMGVKRCDTTSRYESKYTEPGRECGGRGELDS
jgi:hypothetical protein